MNKTKRQALEAAGLTVGDAGNLLGLSPEERLMADLRAKMSTKIRQLRSDLNLTQRQLAARLKSSQSRVAKVEAAADDVSIDLMMSSYFALGGRIKMVYTPPKS